MIDFYKKKFVVSALLYVLLMNFLFWIEVSNKLTFSPEVFFHYF